MGWFESQIRERKEADERLLEESFFDAAGVVLGESTARSIREQSQAPGSVLDEIGRYYHLKPVEIPENIAAGEGTLRYWLRRTGLMRREIELKKGWYRDSYGPILGTLAEGEALVALLPGKLTGYYYTDPATGKRVWLRSGTEGRLKREAFCFYRPLPMRKIGIRDLLLYMQGCITAGDVIWVAAATGVTTFIGMLLARITKVLTGPILDSGDMAALWAMAVCIVCVTVSARLIDSARGLLLKRLEIKTSMSVEAAVMMRILSLPADFFRGKAPGELKSRAMAVNDLCSLLLNMVLTTGLTSLTSLLYVFQIFRFAPALVVPSFAVILLTVGFSVASTLIQVGVSRRRMELSAKEAGMTYALLGGVQKIRLAGAEKRAFAKWLNLHTKSAVLAFHPPVPVRLRSVISLAVTLFGNIVLYNMAVRSGVSPSSYFAFTAAYGAVMGAFLALEEAAMSAARIRPILEMAEPFLLAEPECSEEREIVTKISGGLELAHVCFRYSDDAPLVLDDLSLKVKPGEYVAVVGKSGCGKSTLVRLLLGFEKPQKGAVYYDGRDLSSLDPVSLRRQIGTVMQDAGLFQGDIYSNIAITAPGLTLEEAWEAAEIAGIAEDIRKMPMGMFTSVSEGQSLISGGQRQRIMIARAIASKPRLLIFDEATSALDNQTQKRVSEALDGMKCTRLVIAHRLSTIRHCDRILVLEDGKIRESGTYEELMALDGFFAGLVKRQLPEEAAAVPKDV